MIPVQFDYAVASSLEEAVRYLEAHPQAHVLAGGTDLIPALTRRHLAPTGLVDLQRIPGLATIARANSGGMHIGALATLAAIAEDRDVRASYPALTEAIAGAGDPQIRNRATLGGNLAQHRSDGDLAAVLLALDASISITGPDGARTAPIDDLLAGSGQLRLDAAEIITAVDLPADAAGSAYEKVRDPASGYATCGVGALVRLDGAGRVAQCRLAVTGATNGVVRLLLLEADLIGQTSSSAAPTGEALQAQLANLPIAGDRNASAEYRAHLTSVLAQRALERAIARAAQSGAN